MTATLSAGVVRRLPGPTGERLCMHTRDGWRWVEQVSGSPATYLDAAALKLLRARLPSSGDVWAVLPQLADPRTAAWPVVASPGLLVDDLFASAPADGLEYRLQALGRFLAALHAVPVDAAAATVLARRERTVAWLMAMPALATRLTDARRRLASQAPRLAELACAPPVSDRAMTLVHGRFSSSQCVPVALGTVILGWREAGVGDPAQDVGFLLGELVEALAVAPRNASLILRCAGALATGYGGIESLDIAARVAERVLDHLALRACVSGSDGGLVSLLLAADGCVDRVLEAVTADGG